MNISLPEVPDSSEDIRAGGDHVPCPRTAYIGSVPVANTSAGEVLLYRMFSTLPRQRLKILEVGHSSTAQCGGCDRQCDGVLSSGLRKGWRFAQTRAPWLFPVLLSVSVRRQCEEAIRMLKDFDPEIIVTVHDKMGWIIASAVADRLGVPLHMICHDHWGRNMEMVPTVESFCIRKWKDVYRRAGGRYCVSPYMEELYRRETGAGGDVLYPCRGPRNLAMVEHTVPERKATDPLIFGYAGNIFHRSYWESLEMVARGLRQQGGRLYLYGPLAEWQGRENGLVSDNVVYRGFIPSARIQATMREECDALVLPMSFEEEDRANMEISFPSKLVEYTGAGLPVLIHGPAYCSAVRWAREQVSVGEVVSDWDEGAVANAVATFKDRDMLSRFSAASAEIGDRHFSFEAVTASFRNGLSRKH